MGIVTGFLSIVLIALSGVLIVSLAVLIKDTFISSFTSPKDAVIKEDNAGKESIASKHKDEIDLSGIAPEKQEQSNVEASASDEVHYEIPANQIKDEQQELDADANYDYGVIQKDIGYEENNEFKKKETCSQSFDMRETCENITDAINENSEGSVSIQGQEPQTSIKNKNYNKNHKHR